MKNTLLLLVVLITLGSCTKEGIIRRKENKIIGAWTFEKVTYKEYGAIFRDNITIDYQDDVVEFFPDFSAIYDDYSERTIFEGEWNLYVEEEDVFDNSMSDLEFFFDAIFFDFYYDENFHVFGGIERLNRNKMRLEGSNRYGKYLFVLRRL